MYSQYCANFTRATETIINLRQSSKDFRRFETTHPLPLNAIDSYLILPIQRIPRYFMLLEDFLQHTPEQHPDHPNLGKAVTMTKGIAVYVNERIRALDYMDRVYQIDLALDGECKDLVQPHRRWIADGELSRIRSSLGITYTVPVKFYLFNDILVVAEKNMAGGFQYNQTLQLMDTFVIEDEESAAFRRCFKVVSVDSTGQFVAKSDEVKWGWIETISKAIVALIETKGEDSQIEYKSQREALAESLKIDLSGFNIDHNSLTLIPAKRDERAYRALSTLSTLYRSENNLSDLKEDNQDRKSVV